MTEKYKRHPNISCIICGKKIYRRPGEIRENKGRVFCSSKCNGINCRKETPCTVCGKLILSGLHKKTCSRKCSNINRAGIKYDGRRVKDKVNTNHSIKIRLINDRGPVCERCGYSKFEILQIHHKNRNRKDNDLTNLELMCPNCHFEEHYFEKSWLKEILRKK